MCMSKYIALFVSLFSFIGISAAQHMHSSASHMGGSHQFHQQNVHQHQTMQHSFAQRRAHNWNAEHRTWEQRGGYHGYRIPENRFRGRFGVDHRFRLHRCPFVFAGGFPRFRFGGFWFDVLDPWPAYWEDDWYDTDDVYIVYEGSGYYLYNYRYPHMGIAINVIF